MKRLFAVLVTLFVLTGCSVSAADVHKVFVCKYVGTPGVDERLQTGDNPISVDLSSIPGAPQNPQQAIGFEFADAQGRSLVLAVDIGQPEPPVTDCPPPVPPPSSPPSAPPSVPPSEPPPSAPPSTPPSNPPPPPPPPSGPPPSEPPTAAFTALVGTPICDGDVPYLDYEVAVENSTDTTVTITFQHPTDPTQDVVYEDLPFTGSLLWPGAVVGPGGEPLDWPGWTQLPDGTWVEGDEFDWVRPFVRVRFEVNPVEVIEVGYPPATPLCDANPPGAPEPPPAAPPTDVASDVAGLTAPQFFLLILTVAVAVGLSIRASRRYQR